jgi:hypothetical protein
MKISLCNETFHAINGTEIALEVCNVPFQMKINMSLHCVRRSNIINRF